MLSSAISIARKDITLLLAKSSGVLQSILLGMLLIFVFSLSQKAGEVISPQTAGTLFCLSSVFCQILIINSLFALEADEGIYIALLLAPIPIQSIALGKFFAGFVLLIITQCILLPASIVFLSQSIYSFVFLSLGIILLNAGLVSLGVLLGAITVRSSSKDSLMTVLLFPLLIPLLLACIRIIEASFSHNPESLSSWFPIALSFNAFFIASLLALFPFLYSYK